MFLSILPTTIPDFGWTIYRIVPINKTNKQNKLAPLQFNLTRWSVSYHILPYSLRLFSSSCLPACLPTMNSWSSSIASSFFTFYVISSQFNLTNYLSYLPACLCTYVPALLLFLFFFFLFLFFFLFSFAFFFFFFFFFSFFFLFHPPRNRTR